jgi:alanine racemase
MKKEQRLGLRTWIEIDKKGIKHNYDVFRSLIAPTTKMLGVVKSNAYGHNFLEFAKELEKLGVDYLAVDSAVEGIALRKEGIRSPILILGYVLPEMLEKAVLNDLDITVSNFDYFKEIKKHTFGKPIRIHIKVDTGMHRHGFQESDMKKVLSEINDLNKKGKINVVGLFTHFASAKNPAFPKDTKNQIEIFNNWREAFVQAGIKPICHACATSGIILFPEAQYDMVRIGIGLYGIWPSRETKAFIHNKFKLEPVLSWKAVIGEINNIKKGEGIGYDFTEKLRRDSRVAIIPIGYWHGYTRALSGIGQILIKGQRAKVLGRICMDIITVDITGIKDTKIGDEVTIIGKDGKEEITVDDIATLLEASSYELITRINPLIKRIYR